MYFLYIQKGSKIKIDLYLNFPSVSVTTNLRFKYPPVFNHLFEKSC